MDNNLNTSKTIIKYKQKMGRVLSTLFPKLSIFDIDNILDYSISKRLQDTDCKIKNNYLKKESDITLLQMADYIANKEPIVTPYGVLFKKHGTVPNPLGQVIHSFMDLRGIHKNEMFKYPKGSELFEKFNLAQTLDKIDVNAIYGILGLYISIIYDENIAPSVTSMGRSLISSAILCFEMFLSNNVKFQSLEELLEFIDNVRLEYSSWNYNDCDVLDIDKHISIDECFYKIIMTCGYQYIPSTEDMDIIWKILSNCNQKELNRLYYKNNLYNFMDNSICRNLIVKIISEMNRPYISPMKPPKECIEDLDKLKSLLLEYVFYGYQVIDRVDRNKNMIKNISVVSDTDSSFVALDAWYRYNLEYLKGIDFKILHQQLDIVKYCDSLDDGLDHDPCDAIQLFHDCKRDEFGDLEEPLELFKFVDPEYDYDFYNDEIIEQKHWINPLVTLPQDNLRFAIINIMCYVLDGVINKYMINFTKNSHSYRGDSNCKIIMKNEFFMTRMLLTEVKKQYASLQQLQEGNYLGKDGTLAITGINCMAKSDFPESTRKELKKILLEDILKSDNIDPVKIMKDLAVMEKKIYNDLKSGSKKYYKPLTVKAIDSYAMPMSEQGIKASIAWNYIKEDELPLIDLNSRNGLSIVKVKININTVDKIKDKYPEQYKKITDLIDPNKKIMMDDGAFDISNVFKREITSIAIPADSGVPGWVMELIDYNQIVSDNLSGFPASGVGISKLDNRDGVIYTNVIKL